MSDVNQIPSILAAQSHIIDNINTYNDYRDYIFSLTSSSFLKKQIIRINLENHSEYVIEFKSALKKNHFLNFKISSKQPDTWSTWMLEQLKNEHCDWVMPLPGDHIFMQDEQNEFVNLIIKAKKLSVNAIAYGHSIDFRQMVDWKSVDLIYEDEECIVINWGWKKYLYQNPKLKSQTIETIHKVLQMPPVPGFCLYDFKLMHEILSHMKPNNFRWHDMEWVNTNGTQNFKLLIPKKLFYYHVHNYWLGLHEYIVSKEQSKSIDLNSPTEQLYGMYIPTQYNWQSSDTIKVHIKSYKEKIVGKYKFVESWFDGNIFKKQIKTNKSVTLKNIRRKKILFLFFCKRLQIKFVKIISLK